MRTRNPNVDSRLARRFWKYTEKTDSCWNWIGNKVNGYGQLSSSSTKNGTVYAHHVAWNIFVGPIPDDKFVMRTCDNKSCVNPDHLYLGTREEWQAKRLQKSVKNKGTSYKLTWQQVEEVRQLLLSGNHSSTEIAEMFGVSAATISKISTQGYACDPAQRTVRNVKGGSKLTRTQVEDIRRRVSGGETRTALAREYGVDLSHVSRICGGKSRTHIPYLAERDGDPCGDD